MSKHKCKECGIEHDVCTCDVCKKEIKGKRVMSLAVLREGRQAVLDSRPVRIEVLCHYCSPKCIVQMAVDDGLEKYEIISGGDGLVVVFCDPTDKSYEEDGFAVFMKKRGVKLLKNMAKALVRISKSDIKEREARVISLDKTIGEHRKTIENLKKEQEKIIKNNEKKRKKYLKDFQSEKRKLEEEIEKMKRLIDTVRGKNEV
ncbi:MAG: hypothetical protein GF375_05010 [Candidatus Omnitrophica bacterium]|nr:hypothetical protein [Candidatus Omnitrophota bacterium]